MPAACPNTVELQRFLLGQVSEAEADTLEQHLVQCSRCRHSLQALDKPDSLLQTARAVTNRPALQPHAGAAGLIARLVQVSPTASDAEQSTGGTAANPAVDLQALLAPPQGPGEIGRLGPYRVLDVLGAGGMGVVFRAEDPQLSRLVALKVIKPQLATSATARERFLREARMAAAIEHDHIVPLYHVGEDRGVPYLAFPLLKGETLDNRLQRTERLPMPEVLRIGREIAAGLAAAHARGLIHRDIKPANVWLEATGGRVKILDFGLARAVAEAQESPQATEASSGGAGLTLTGAVLGTPAYMAPEQARGGSVDARADLFSLGAVLYRMVTGQVPFPGSDVTAVLSAVAKEQPVAPRLRNPKVPARLSHLILALLAKGPADRPNSAAAVADGLAALEKRGRRRWWAVAAGAAAALLVVAAFLFRPNPDDGKPDNPSDTPEVVVSGVEFVAGGTYDAGTNPLFVTTGDLNGDGKTDLVVVNQGEFTTPSAVRRFGHASRTSMATARPTLPSSIWMARPALLSASCWATATARSRRPSLIPAAGAIRAASRRAISTATASWTLPWR
jgi:serine/threonine protein kinase